MTHEDTLFDYLQDMKINADRDVRLDGQGDLLLTRDFENVKQSVAINVSHEIQPLIGRTIDGATLERVADAIRRAIEDDPQVQDSIDRVKITTIDKRNNAVEVEAYTSIDESFELEVPA